MGKHQRVNRIILVLFISFLFLLFFFSYKCVSDESSIMIIDLNPTIVYSRENFSVSVYDPSIQNSTPYLVNVTIEFNGAYYEITDDTPGGELQLTAPLVTSKTTYDIFAYKQGYEPTNTTLFVEPSPSYQLVITVGSYEVDAKKAFSVLVTDENANPMQGATVLIQGQSGSGSQDTTDQAGIATLIAPNIEEIHLVAFKQNYTQATKTIWVRTTPGFFESLFSNPLFPVFLAVVILIAAILYVQLSKYLFKKPKDIKYFTEKPVSAPPVNKPPDTNQTPSQPPLIPPPQYQPITTYTKPSKISQKSLSKGNLSPSNPKSHQEQSTSKNGFHQHKWFNDNKIIEEKIDALQPSNKHTFNTKWFSDNEKIDQDIDRTLKKKKRQNK